LGKAAGTPLVVDPVMVAKGGHPLIGRHAVGRAAPDRVCGGDHAQPAEAGRSRV
jgi:hypothetical protein